MRAAARLWRYDFRHDVIAVRDQDGFATSGEADFAKLVSKGSSDRLNACNLLATRSYFVNSVGDLAREKGQGHRNRLVV
jgi:hypothetical protein